MILFTSSLRPLFFAALAVSGLAAAPLANASTFLIDFGPNDTTNGLITGPRDDMGNYWNNSVAGTAGVAFTPASLTNLITIENIPSTIGISFSGGWKSNGFKNGGLLNPSRTLLGNLGVGSATGDYFFAENGNGTTGTASLTINHLNPAFQYNLDLFGTRDTNGAGSGVRNTLYTVVDAFGTQTFTLQTSGAGAGTGTNGSLGNDDTIAGFTGLKPDASGNITVTVTAVTTSNNTFGYLGAAQITEVVPEPGVTGMLATGLLGLLAVRRRRSAATNA